MKTMQDFYTQLASPTGEIPALDRRLASLKNFSKKRLAAAASEGPWFIWEAEQTAAAA